MLAIVDAHRHPVVVDNVLHPVRKLVAGIDLFRREVERVGQIGVVVHGPAERRVDGAPAEDVLEEARGPIDVVRIRP